MTAPVDYHQDILFAQAVEDTQGKSFMEQVASAHAGTTIVANDGSVLATDVINFKQEQEGIDIEKVIQEAIAANRVDQQYEIENSEEEPLTALQKGKVADRQTDRRVRCPHCSETLQRRSNLIRHIKRKHKMEEDSLLKEVQTGNCVCLECGLRIWRIVELRKHLALKHGFRFDLEVLKFPNVKCK